VSGEVEADDPIILIVIGGIALVVISKFLQTQLLILKENLIYDFYFIINNYLVHLGLFFLLGVFVSYVCYAIYQKIRRRKKEKMKVWRKLDEEQLFVDKFLKEDLGSFSYDDLKLRLDEIEGMNFLKKYEGLRFRIKDAKNVLIEVGHKERLREIDNKREFAEREVKELELKIEELRKSDVQKKNSLRCELEMDENKVFDKFDLNEEEINILLEEGYRQVNEYCVFQKRVITVLIRPTLNHSVAHTFLVWSVRQLLESYFEVEEIVEHETRDADLTFKIKSRLFAIEIETGTLLRKKDQSEKKIKSLNRKYKNRWLIVVSKRELVKKYSSFGLCSQRKWVSEKLEKMAGI